MAFRGILSLHLRASFRRISMERQSIAAGFEHLGLSVTQQLIRGKWTDTSDGDTKVNNPTTGEITSKVPCMGRSETNDTISSAYDSSNFKESHGNEVPFVEDTRHNIFFKIVFRSTKKCSTVTFSFPSRAQVENLAPAPTVLTLFRCPETGEVKAESETLNGIYCPAIFRLKEFLRWEEIDCEHMLSAMKFRIYSFTEQYSEAIISCHAQLGAQDEDVLPLEPAQQYIIFHDQGSGNIIYKIPWIPGRESWDSSEMLNDLKSSAYNASNSKESDEYMENPETLRCMQNVKNVKDITFVPSNGKETPVVEEIRHGKLIRINCYNFTKDGFKATVSYQFCAQIPDPVPVQMVVTIAEVIVRVELAQVKASEIVNSSLCESALKKIKLASDHLGVTCNDSYGSNIQVLNVEP